MNFENVPLTSKCEGINLREMNKMISFINNLNFNKSNYVFAPRNRVTFQEALVAYINYKQIQCLTLNEEGLVVDVETYYRGEGLDVCLDFDEMLNGHWFILD